MTNDPLLPPSNAQRLWRWVRLFLTIGALVSLGYFLSQNADALETFQSLDFAWLALGFLAYSGMVLTRAFALQVTHYKALGGVSLARWWSVAVITGTLNHLLPSSAGGAWRALTLKVHRALALSDSLAIQLWMLLGMTFVGALTLALGVGGLELEAPMATSLMTFAGFGLLVSGLGLLIFHRAARVDLSDDASSPRWKRVLARTHAVGIGLPSSARLCLASLANILLGALAVYAAFAAMGVVLPLFVALIFGSLLTLSTLLMLTPGNLGIIEGVVAIMAALIGRDVESALTGMLVVRIMNLASVLFPTPIALLLLRKWDKKHEPR